MTTSVLVTGGAGYVGSHACRALARSGYRPVVFDNLSTGHRDFVRWGPFVRGDIRDSTAVAAAIESHGCEAALHFAASAYVGESMVDPGKYYLNNVAGTVSLLEGLRAAGCTRLVFSSTCAVYGAPARLPIDEATRPDPINPYGTSKRAAECAVADFGRAHGLRAILLRYFNACGGDAELGELRDPETHLIPRAMMALQGHLPDFAVYGADFPTPDGTAVRDYIHVDDLADAHVVALGKLLEGHAGGTYNLGTGRGHSVLDVLRAIERVAGARLPTVTGERRPGDPPLLVADPSLARRELGLRTDRSTLETIVRGAWTWHERAHPRRNAVAAMAADCVT
jgi:UDP-glucose 4-epimerase/UDP-arabinose 4-epimerase